MIHASAFLPGLAPVAGNLTSNGGLLVLREVEERLGFSGVITAPLPDMRNPLLVTHRFADMARARMMAITAGDLSPSAPSFVSRVLGFITGFVFDA